MDPLRIHPIALQSAQFSYRSMRNNPNVVRILGAQAFLHYIHMRRARLQPLLVPPLIDLASMDSTCLDAAKHTCQATDSIGNIQSAAAVAGDGAIPFAVAQSPSSMRNLPELELDWPHKIPEKVVTVYVRELQQANDPNLTGTVLDLLY